MSWFNVDKAGLAAILERRGKSFALSELIQNSWDSGTERVEVMLTPVAGTPLAELSVEDWGEGFEDMEDSFTMFKPSRRAKDTTKRGRFSLGEKLVLAICRSARVSSTTGSVRFEQGDRRSRSSDRREKGTHFTATIRMTRDEYDEVSDSVRFLIPPVPTIFNGRHLRRLAPLATFSAKLPTELADDEGQLRRTVRTATVEVYQGGGRGDLLELGIPVVENETGFRVNVLQKIPLNMDRDNVSPAFLKTVHALLLNHVHAELDDGAAAAPWAQEALGNALTSPEAVREMITRRFGEKAVAATPGDREANAQAEAAGYTVIPGGALSADAWANVRKHGIVSPASQVFPTPKPGVLAAANAEKTVCRTCGRPF